MIGAVIHFSIADEEEMQAYDDRSAAPPSTPHVPRVARLLALAHHVEQLVDQGVFRDYAQAARTLGITRARLSQVMDLRLLAPSIQGNILTGRLEVFERQLRPLLRMRSWKDQESYLQRMGTNNEK